MKAKPLVIRKKRLLIVTSYVILFFTVTLQSLIFKENLMKRIKYLIPLYFLVSTAIASSVVNLGGGGVVAPATSVNLSLNGLVPAMTYSVICYINTSYPFQYIMLGSSFSDSTSSISSYSLNGNYVTQDQLLVGQNIVVVNGNFTNPTTGYLVFTNLDQTNSFNVSNCFGIPIQVTSGA
jgi:hypothetical protein